MAYKSSHILTMAHRLDIIKLQIEYNKNTKQKEFGGFYDGEGQIKVGGGYQHSCCSCNWSRRIFSLQILSGETDI